MVKKSTVIFTILALLAFGACACWGYTVSQWPVPGIPNTVFGPGAAFGPGPLVPGQYQTNPYQTPMYNYGAWGNFNPYTGGVGNRMPRGY
jgi:hypothetical protein